MKEAFEKLVAQGKLEAQHVDPLAHLVANGFCMHRSWGFGRIKTVDTVFSRFTIDFPSKAGHTMDLAFAAEQLKAISKDHILARKAADIDGLRTLAASNHLELVKLVINSFEGKATLDQIQKALVPEVIRDDWKKWWDTAKHEMKKDGHFQVPTKKTDPIVYQAETTSLQDRLLADFRAARGLKARTAAANEIVKSVGDLNDKVSVANEVIAALNVEIASHQRTQPAVALEGIFVRDDLQAAAGLVAADGAVSSAGVWSQEGVKFGAVMEALTAAKHHRALESFKTANPRTWSETVRNFLNAVPAKLCKEFASILIADGKMNELKETLAKLIGHHAASSELLLWLAKERTDAFADILGPEVFRAMLTAMERDQFNEKKSNRLRDFILADQELLVELIGSADFEVIKDLTRALQFSPCFDDMDKRSLLARIVKHFPAAQSLISGESNKQESFFIVSWESLERRKDEYADLVHKQIPANSKEIAIARSYGDLRENHEYKAAKEMQKLLMKRKMEIEAQLLRARGTDFANAKTDVVSIGTIVKVTDLASNSPETFTILGGWDSDPDKGVISYLTPIAQCLLNHKPGDEVAMATESAARKFRIESIAAWKTA